MNIKTKIRAFPSIPNKNICVSIGSMLAVQYFYEKLNFYSIFSKHKSRGLDLNSLLIGLVSYKLTENFSIKEAGKWLNQEEILEILNLENFHEKVLYRTLEILGRNKEEILSDILGNLFSVYSFEETDINLDWTSIVLHGTKSKLGKYGYSRDHRPDKLQITVGVSELKKPINVPIGITVNKGNVLDLQHFHETYNQVKSRLKRGSLIVFDKGANTIDNIKLIQEDKMTYLTSMKLNASDDKIIENFSKDKAELIDPQKRIYGIKIIKPNSIKYFYFSESLQEKQLEAKAKTILKKLQEAKEIQEIIVKNKKLPKKFRINNELIVIDYSFSRRYSSPAADSFFPVLTARIMIFLDVQGRSLKRNTRLSRKRVMRWMTMFIF